MDLALDDVIKSQQKKKIHKRGDERIGARGNRVGNVMRYQDSDQPRGLKPAFFSKIPSGRWKHDKYEELYGSRKEFKRSRVLKAGNNDIVKLNFTNLNETVSTNDLEELLGGYPVLGVAVHYDESGFHLGTADVFVKRRAAEDIIKDFRGLALDGREMKLFIVDEKDAGVRSRLERIRYNPIRERTMKRRGGDAPGPSGSSRSRLPKPKPASKLSIDELDRELDSYMKISQHKRVTAD
uniref:RRM domain-containing protein n=1 Tax=Acrobeloides nanus TaxID=290746 RepID=A0A914EB38_9BILA